MKNKLQLAKSAVFTTPFSKQASHFVHRLTYYLTLDDTSLTPTETPFPICIHYSTRFVQERWREYGEWIEMHFWAFSTSVCRNMGWTFLEQKNWFKINDARCLNLFPGRSVTPIPTIWESRKAHENCKPYAIWLLSLSVTLFVGCCQFA